MSCDDDYVTSSERDEEDSESKTLTEIEVIVKAKEEHFIPETANIFVRMPSRNDHPAGREHSKRVDAINFIIDKVTENASAPTRCSGVKKLWEKINKRI